MTTTIKNSYKWVCEKTLAIVEWRSSLSTFYLFAANALFWITVFYVPPQVQYQIIIFTAVTILSFDILFTPTDNNSVITHVFFWPFRSLFRTFALLLLLYSAHELHEGDKEYSCWAAYIALLLLLINPVWVHRKTSRRIREALVKSVDKCVINPLSRIYAAIYYVCSFQFLKGFPDFAHNQLKKIKAFFGNIIVNIQNTGASIGRYFSSTFTTYISKPVSSATNKSKQFLYFWLFAGWWPSVVSYLDNNIGQPVKDRYRKGVNCVKYVAYGYWISPMTQKMKVVLAEQACVLWNLSKVAGIKIGVLLKDTVVWPVLIWTYDTALSPLVLILKDKFKIVEDNILIYFLAPVCQTVVNIVPDKSPFVDDSDVEFEDFVPLANDGNDSDASWDPEEANRERKRQEEAKTAKAQAKPQTALFEFPDFNELGSSDEEFMLE